MAMSVLQRPFQTNKNICGVWCSVQNDFIFRGTREECHKWKHEEEEKEQEIMRQQWRKTYDSKGYIGWRNA